MESKRDLNLKRYTDTIGFNDITLKNMRKYTRFPLGRYVYRIKEKVKCFIICGFTHHGTKLNDKYHLYIPHKCGNGDGGLAQLIGFRKVQ